MITRDDGVRILNANSSVPEVIHSKIFPGRPDVVANIRRFVRRAVFITPPATSRGVISLQNGGTLTWSEIAVNDGSVGTG